MACCLTAPSHYLNQCIMHLLCSEIQWHSPQGSFLGNAQGISPWDLFGNHTFKISTLPWTNELIPGHQISTKLCTSGLDIKHLVYMPIRHVVQKIYVPCTNVHMPSQYLYKPCKAYVYCWENKYMPSLKNHLPGRARNHKSLCALEQDLYTQGMRASLNVEPCTCLNNRTVALWTTFVAITYYNSYER